MNNSANSCHWFETATHWAALPLTTRWPRKDQTGTCSVQAGSIQKHSAIQVSLSDCQFPRSPSWVALLEAAGALENQHNTPFYYLKAPWAPTVKPQFTVDKNNTLKVWLSWEPPLRFYHASCIHPCFPSSRCTFQKSARAASLSNSKRRRN